MTVIDRLARLAAGARPAGDWLLGTCLLTAGGVEVVGEEAIVAHFRDYPLPLAEAATYRSPSGLALFAGDAALFADLYGDNVGRLWRIGAPPALRLRAVSVAFDPDLDQARGDLGFDPALFPELGDPAARHVADAARALARSSPAYRTRAFVLRAFADADTAVALVARYALTPAGIGFSHAALRRRFAGDADLGGTVVADDGAAGDWVPRL